MSAQTPLMMTTELVDEDSRRHGFVYLVSPAGGRFSSAALVAALRAELGEDLRLDTAKESRAAIARNQTLPRCMLIDARNNDAAEWAHWARTDARLCDVPIILLVPEPTESAFLIARKCGADDVVGLGDTDGLVRRVRNLAAFVAGTRPAVEQGVALVVHHDDALRRQAGWILRRSGYELAFANTYGDALARGREKRAAVVIVEQGLLPDGNVALAVSQLRADLARSDLPVVILSSDAILTQPSLPRAATASNGEDWDYLLFQISQVTRPLVAEMRASRRVFWATKVAFRALSSFEPSFGLTYDVSPGGIFVRTTDTPELNSTVNLELRMSPEDDRVVTLRARVVWVHLPRTHMANRCPAGFGVEILDAETPSVDLSLYRAGCNALADRAPAPASLRGSR
jgi:DNA-binding response OmpR family regulator